MRDCLPVSAVRQIVDALDPHMATARPGSAAHALYWQALMLAVLARTFHDNPLGAGLHQKAMDVARDAVVVLQRDGAGSGAEGAEQLIEIEGVL